MKNALFKSTLTACLFFLFQANVFAQTDKKPEWVKMMDGQGSNYFKTVKEFNDYWSSRMMPGEAHEKEKGIEEEDKDHRNFVKKIFQSKEKAHAKSMLLIVEYKRFKGWERDTLPFVQSDGTILPEEERWKIIKSQTQNAQ